MRLLLWYYLAFLTWIVKLVMMLSLVLLPLELWLRQKSNFWCKPFSYVNDYAWWERNADQV